MINALLNILLTLVIAIFIVICVAVLIGVFLLAIGMIGSQNKDIVKRDEGLVKFFEDQNHKTTLNKMRQLLGRQRKEEEYLAGERTYKPRIKD